MPQIVQANALEADTGTNALPDVSDADQRPAGALTGERVFARLRQVGEKLPGGGVQGDDLLPCLAVGQVEDA